MREQTILAAYQKLKKDLESHISPDKFKAEDNLRLERITQLLELLGNPHRRYPAIHIGGTSGKGSTASLTAAILTAAGFKTGLYLSPHLQILNERFLLNFRPTPTTLLAKVYQQLKPALKTVARTNPFGPASYFEVQVALAFSLFAKQKVDVAIIEVGMGGEKDATNVLPAKVAVLTNVGLDHTEILGRDVETIARTKSGIIKSGQTVISGATQPSVRRIIRNKCRQRNAHLLQLDQDFSYCFTSTQSALDQPPRFSVKLPQQTLTGLQLSIPGAFQVANTACALAAAQSFIDQTALPQSLPTAPIKKALQKFTIPGRMEIVQTRPLVVIDGAHNPDKMRASTRALKKICRNHQPRRCLTLIALKADKAAADILPFVLKQTDSLVITSFKSPGLWHPMDPRVLADQVRKLDPKQPFRVIADPEKALKTILKQAAPDDLVWVTGSLYLLASIREHWFPAQKLILAAEKNKTRLNREK